MKKVVVTREVFDETIECLEEHFVVDANQRDEKLSRERLFEKIADADGIQTASNDRVDEEFLAAARNVSIIANTAVGYNNIDLEACSKRKVIVTNTPGVLDQSVADFAMGLMIAACRRMGEAERYLRSGNWRSVYLKQMLGIDVNGATLGLIGFGRIGQEIAKRARGFSMRILYHSRNQVNANIERQLGAQFVNKDDLLRQADVVMLILPYSPETHHFIGETELSLMKERAVLVNVARGGIVDDSALIRALRDRRIYAAGLDVFEGEPAINPEFLDLENVVLSPHIASGSESTRKAMAMTAANNLVEVLAHGRPPLNWVNRE
jgi:gluconate 2-dehydrogenase